MATTWQDIRTLELEEFHKKISELPPCFPEPFKRPCLPVYNTVNRGAW